MSWDELGVLLRTQRLVMAQLLRAGMDTRIAYGVLQAEATDYAKHLFSKSVDFEQITQEICSEALQQLAQGDEGDEAREKEMKARVKKRLDRITAAVMGRVVTVVSQKAAKQILVPNVRGESADTLVYQSILSALRKIKENRWSPEARPALELPGGMLSALSRRVMQSYDKRPSFGGVQPIPVREAETTVRLEDGKVVLTLKLTSNNVVTLALRPSKGTHWHTLREIAAQRVTHGDCRLVLDPHKKKWYAILAYEAEAKTVSERTEGRALIVHRGTNNALTLLTTDGGFSYVSGSKLLKQLRVNEARTRDMRSVSGAELGRGSHGHGKDRRYAHYQKDKLRASRDNIVTTWCQQMAHHICKLAARHGCDRLVIEDYGGIEPHTDQHLRRVLFRFPLYELKKCIKNVAEIRSLTLLEVPSEYISTSCPACGNEDFRQHNVHTGVFHCRACDYDRGADFVAALNMLKRSKLDTSVWDARLRAVKRLTKELEEDVQKAPARRGRSR